MGSFGGEGAFRFDQSQTSVRKKVVQSKRSQNLTSSVEVISPNNDREVHKSGD